VGKYQDHRIRTWYLCLLIHLSLPLLVLDRAWVKERVERSASGGSYYTFHISPTMCPSSISIILPYHLRARDL